MNPRLHRTEAERNLNLAMIEKCRDDGQCGIGYVHLCEHRPGRWHRLSTVAWWAAAVLVVIGIVTAYVKLVGG